MAGINFTSTLDVIWEWRSDPGDYPNALAASPLPDEGVPVEMTGAIQIHRNDTGEFPSLEALAELLADGTLDADTPYVSDWHIAADGHSVRLSPIVADLTDYAAGILDRHDPDGEPPGFEPYG